MIRSIAVFLVLLWSFLASAQTPGAPWKADQLQMTPISGSTCAAGKTCLYIDTSERVKIRKANGTTGDPQASGGGGSCSATLTAVAPVTCNGTTSCNACSDHTVALTGVVPVNKGGTNATSGGSLGSVPAWGSGNAYAFSAAPSSTHDILHGNPSGTGIPTWGYVDLTSEVGSTILPIANGGTGSATRNYVMLTGDETIAGTKTFSSTPTMQGFNSNNTSDGVYVYHNVIDQPGAGGYETPTGFSIVHKQPLNETGSDFSILVPSKAVGSGHAYARTFGIIHDANGENIIEFNRPEELYEGGLKSRWDGGSTTLEMLKFVKFLPQFDGADCSGAHAGLAYGGHHCGSVLGTNSWYSETDGPALWRSVGAYLHDSFLTPLTCTGAVSYDPIRQGSAARCTSSGNVTSFTILPPDDYTGRVIEGFTVYIRLQQSNAGHTWPSTIVNGVVLGGFGTIKPTQTLNGEDELICTYHASDSKYICAVQAGSQVWAGVSDSRFCPTPSGGNSGLCCVSNGSAWVASSCGGGGGGGATLDAGDGLATLSYTGAVPATINLQLNGSGGLSKTLGAGHDLGIAASGVTNAMLAGSIANAKLSNSSLTFNGIACSLGGSCELQRFLNASRLRVNNSADSFYTEFTSLASANRTLTIPDVTGTLAVLSLAQSWSAVQTHTNAGRIRINNSADSFYAELTAAATANRTITLPDATTTLLGTDNAATVTNKTINGSNNTLSNIGNSSLVNSQVTINGSAVSLGGSITVGAAPTGSASNDLSGTYPGPTVAKILGKLLCANVGTAAAGQDGQCLKWDNGNSCYGVAACTGGGTDAISLRGVPIAAGAASPTLHDMLEFDGSEWTLAAQNIDAPGHSGDILVDNGLGFYARVTMSGDATIAAGGAFTIATVTVPKGGTGRTTLTNHGVLIGAGTSAVTQLAAAVAGTLFTGQGTGSDPAFSSTPTLGIAGATKGTLALAGDSSGTVTIQPQSAAGTYNFNLPTGAGTAGQPLLSGGGGSSPMTFGTLGVAGGGFGLTTLTAHSLYVGNGTSAPAALGSATNGQIPIGSTGADPVLATITGTANRLGVTNGAGSITLNIDATQWPSSIAGDGTGNKALVATGANSATWQSIVNSLSNGGGITASCTNGACTLGASGIAASAVTGTAVVESRTVTGTNGISGGGDLSTNRTLSLDQAFAATWTALETFAKAWTSITSGSNHGIDITPSVAGDAATGTNTATPIFANLTGTVNLAATGGTNSSGYTGLLVNIIETAIGSGTKKLLDLEVGGVARFFVTNAGLASMVNATVTSLSVAGIVTNTSGGVLGTVDKIPVANGGTNSSTALVNGRVMTSVGGAIVEGRFIDYTVLCTSSTTGGAAVDCTYTLPAGLDSLNTNACRLQISADLKDHGAGGGTVGLTVGTSSGGNDLGLVQTVTAGTTTNGTSYYELTDGTELGSKKASTKAYLLIVDGGSTVYFTLGAPSGTVSGAVKVRVHLTGKCM